MEDRTSWENRTDIIHTTMSNRYFHGGSVIKEPAWNVGDIGDAGSIPGSRRSPGEGNGNLLQYEWVGGSHGLRSGQAAGP